MDAVKRENEGEIRATWKRCRAAALADLKVARRFYGVTDKGEALRFDLRTRPEPGAVICTVTCGGVILETWPEIVV